MLTFIIFSEHWINYLHTGNMITNINTDDMWARFELSLVKGGGGGRGGGGVELLYCARHVRRKVRLEPGDDKFRNFSSPSQV